MATPAILRRDFYVYALFREDGMTPFYIGKGRGTRMFVHERAARRFTTHKDRIIQKMLAANLPIYKIKLSEHLTDAEAKQIEVDLIQLIGRWPKGPLSNLTDGGDGVSNLAPESRARQIAANQRTWNDPVVRARRSNGISAAWTPERRAKQSKDRIDLEKRAAKLAERERKAADRMARKEEKARHNSPEAKAARRNSPALIAQRLWLRTDPVIRQRRIEAQKAAFSTPEAKAKRSAAQKLRWQKWGRSKQPHQ